MAGGASCSGSSALVSRESPTSLCLDFDRLDIVALTMIEGFGPATARAHLERIRRDGQPLDAALPRGTLIAARKAARGQLDAAARVGARCVVDGDPEYPSALRDLESVPLHFWSMGD